MNGFANRGSAMRHVLSTAHAIFPKDGSRLADGPFCVVAQRGSFTLVPFGSNADYRHSYFVDWDAGLESWIFRVVPDF